MSIVKKKIIFFTEEHAVEVKNEKKKFFFKVQSLWLKKIIFDLEKAVDVDC